MPVRRSRFRAADRALGDCNIEVAAGGVAPFALCAGDAPEVGLYDRQTQLEGTPRGRNGSGRAVTYRGRYLKGVGRTPAAENWDDAGDLYHASGHLAPSSAIRELAITEAVRACGLEHAIVPCDGLLAAPLTSDEAEQAGAADTSSHPSLTPADGHLLALSVRPADFARASNVVFALDHHTGDGRELGFLVLDLERHLHPPGARDGLRGAPTELAAAMNAAFRRGLEHFTAFGDHGLLWLHHQSNITLDGRFLDLETPLFAGVPLVVAAADGEDDDDPVLLGFEEFAHVRQWRLFVTWLRSRLALLGAAEQHLGDRPARFLDALRRAVDARFGPDHLLFDDDALVAAAQRTLAHRFGDAAARRLDGLAAHAFDHRVLGRGGPPPDLGWEPLRAPICRPVPYPHTYLVPRGLQPEPSPDAGAYAARVAALGARTDTGSFLAELAGSRIPSVG